ncbi:MAG: hypothetical protein C0403_02110 [Desulfobacterium sp.]|nr:hypothetical protein [Desulfobacterium sp.]
MIFFDQVKISLYSKSHHFSMAVGNLFHENGRRVGKAFSGRDCLISSNHMEISGKSLNKIFIVVNDVIK